MEAERLEARLRGPGQAPMAFVNSVEAFFLEHAEAFLHGEDDADRWSEGSHALVGPGLGFLPVEIEAWRASLRLLRPGPVADADKRHAGRCHPAFLGPGNRHV